MIQKIELVTLTDVRHFVDIVSSIEGDIRLIDGKGYVINGKSILIISTAKITQLLDGTGLDSISIMTEVEKDGDDGEHYFVYYETDPTPNGNSDTSFTVKL